MTHEKYQSISPREASPGASSRLFYFYRVRSGADAVRFLPGAGAKLHFANRDVDTLTLPGLPAGFLEPGDRVHAGYRGVRVFVGDVDSIAEEEGKGGTATQTVVCAGPWAKMARMVYRQYWTTAGDPALSSRIILNSTRFGATQGLASELAEIVNYGAGACGYAAVNPQSGSTISVPALQLPFDECRDITVADAIKRELRFFPDAVCRFQYGSGATKLVIEKPERAPASSDPAFAAAARTSRRRVYDPHPINGVDLELETSGEVNGVLYRNISHQTAGNAATDNPDCLYATLQIRGASCGATVQSFKSVTEDIPENLNNVDWWKARHPRLKNIATSAITITNALRTPRNYPRISAATAGELDAIGKHYEISTFSCHAKIETGDDTEQDLYLQMQYLTTDATTKTYTWTADSFAETSESVPSGLAQAILAARSGALRSESFAMRLGDALPALGSALVEEGCVLYLQSFDVDCDSLTAELSFGAPEHLSPDDMASLLSGFRNRRTARSTTLRATGKASDSDAKVELGVIRPLSSTEFAPGVKSKTTIKSTAGNATTGAICLDSAGVPQGKTVGVRTLTLTGAGENGADKQVKILAEEDMTINPNGGAGGGWTGPRQVLLDTRYDASSHKLQKKCVTETWTNGVLTAMSPDPNEATVPWTDYHTAEEETV